MEQESHGRLVDLLELAIALALDLLEVRDVHQLVHGVDLVGEVEGVLDANNGKADEYLPQLKDLDGNPIDIQKYLG